MPCVPRPRQPGTAGARECRPPGVPAAPAPRGLAARGSSPGSQQPMGPFPVRIFPVLDGWPELLRQSETAGLGKDGTASGPVGKAGARVSALENLGHVLLIGSRCRGARARPRASWLAFPWEISSLDGSVPNSRPGHVTERPGQGSRQWRGEDMAFSEETKALVPGPGCGQIRVENFAPGAASRDILRHVQTGQSGQQGRRAAAAAGLGGHPPCRCWPCLSREGPWARAEGVSCCLHGWRGRGQGGVPL